MIPPRAAWRVKKPTIRPKPPILDGLLEEGTDAIPVRITIVQDDVTTGWDDGALGFEDDAVWFSGRAMGFHLAAPDILPGAYLLSRREAVTSGEALNQGFPLRHPTRGVWVRVQVLTKDKEEKAEHEARLIAGVKRLRASGEGSPWSEARAEGGTVGGSAEGRGAKPTAPSAGVVSQVEGVLNLRQGAEKLDFSRNVVPQVEGVQSEYPPLLPRPGLLGPLPKRRSPEETRRFRHTFAAGAIACVTVNFFLSATHLYPKLASLAGIMVFPCFLNSVAGPEDMTDEERRALRGIADEESDSLALTPPLSP